MTRLTLWIALLIVGATPHVSGAQTTAGETERPSEGLWITERMWDGITKRVANQLADRYGFDEDQRYLTRQVLRERVVPWFESNRAGVQPVVNWYFEMLLNDEPPSVDEVAEWAKQAGPLLEQFRTMLVETGDEMRGFMTEEQQEQMDIELQAAGAMLDIVDRRIGGWARHQYDPVTDWWESPNHDPHGAGPPPDLAVDNGADAAEQPETARRFVLKPGFEDPWETYVNAFIKRYALSEEQQALARRVLVVVANQRDRYLLLKGPTFDWIERKLAAAKDESETRTLMARYEKLVRPLDTKFQILKEKLHKLPTREQVQAASDKPPLSEPEHLALGALAER